MKILVLSHRVPYPPIKGEKIRIYYQLQALANTDYEVSLFCPAHEAEDEALASEYAAKTSTNVVSGYAGKGWLWMLLGLFTGRSLSVSKFHIGDLQKKLNAHLTDHQVDVLYCTSSAMAEYALGVGKQ